MSLTPDPREAKLPRWAQDTLSDLRRHNDRLREALDDVPVSPDTQIWVRASRAPARAVGGKNTHVYFDVLDRPHRTELIVSPTDNGIKIMAVGGEPESLVVVPEISNVVRVEFRS